MVLNIVMLFVLAGILAFMYKVLIQREMEYYTSLPTLEEAQLELASKYPDYTNCFKLTTKVIETLHGNWGASIHFYGDFLECKELGISIRVRLEEKMS